MWRGGASDAMGISMLAVCCRGALKACLESDRGGEEAGRLIAMGGTGVAQRRSNDKTAIQGDARASMVIASQEPTKESSAVLSRTDLDHDVSILITALEVAGR